MSLQYCPICGAKATGLVAAPGVLAAEQHRCKERTLRGIDASMKQEEREERRRSEAQRLAEGFSMLADDYGE